MALNKYYRNLKGRKLDEEYINEIKDNIKLTKDQRQAYKILTTYNLSKELIMMRFLIIIFGLW